MRGVAPDSIREPARVLKYRLGGVSYPEIGHFLNRIPGYAVVNGERTTSQLFLFRREFIVNVDIPNLVSLSHMIAENIQISTDQSVVHSPTFWAPLSLEQSLLFVKPPDGSASLLLTSANPAALFHGQL